jgi:hypothetical protein
MGRETNLAGQPPGVNSPIDWSSPTSLFNETLEYWKDVGEEVNVSLRVYRVDGDEGAPLEWQLAKAVNFGLDKVTTEAVLKVDCDTYLRAGFLRVNPLESAGASPLFR